MASKAHWSDDFTVELKKRLTAIGLKDIQRISKSYAERTDESGKEKLRFDNLTDGEGGVDLLHFLIELQNGNGVSANISVSQIPKNEKAGDASVILISLIFADGLPQELFGPLYNAFRDINPNLPIGAFGLYEQYGQVYYKNGFFLYSDTPTEAAVEHTLQQLQWMMMHIDPYYDAIMNISV